MDFNDLNGFELLEVEKRMGCSLAKIDEQPVKATYAMAYVIKKRDNENLKWEDVLALPYSEVNEMFTDEDAEAFSEDPKD
jgi:hypothetical protein